MEQVSREQEAKMRRARADMIRRHIAKYGSAVPLESQLGYLAVAEREETLADALELAPLQVAS